MTIAAGGTAHACALVAGGAVDCWGENELGELGDGTSTGPATCEGWGAGTYPCRPTPGPVAGIVSATGVVAGGNFACGLLADDTVTCWGDNSAGELGDATFDPATNYQSSTPLPVTGITGAKQISAGGVNACALVTTGSIYCWGDSENGNLGGGTTTTTSVNNSNCAGQCSVTPIRVGQISTATQISAGGSAWFLDTGSVCAVLAGGTVDCWGLNQHGQLGNGTSTGPENTCNAYSSQLPCSTSPVPVQGITTATQVSVGLYSTCALLAGGSVECWGDNSSGELGDGMANGPGCGGYCSTTPVQVQGIANATQISVGGGFACALLSGGSIDCWGDGYYWGQLGSGPVSPDVCNGYPCSTSPLRVSGITNATQVSLGPATACAAFATGGIDCWGNGDQGQLGNGATTGSDVPVPVNGFP